MIYHDMTRHNTTTG